MSDKIIFHLIQQQFNFGYGLYITRVTPEGEQQVARLTFEDVPQGHSVDPTARLTEESLLSLKNELLKTSFLEVADAQTLKATRYHLEDMRRLVFEPTITEKAK